MKIDKGRYGWATLENTGQRKAVNLLKNQSTFCYGNSLSMYLSGFRDWSFGALSPAESGELSLIMHYRGVLDSCVLFVCRL